METLAIVGTGIAGMGAAHHLQKHFQLSLFEQNHYVGGHTNTISVQEEFETIHMDTGFMVFNYITYPHLCKLFAELNVPVKKTNMSFSVQHKGRGLEYCGSGINGLFAQRRNLFNLSYIRMLNQVARFNRESLEVLHRPELSQLSVGDYIRLKNFGEDMLWNYLVPMSSAVWSTPMEKMLDFSISTLVRFFYNHGFLGLNTQHQWYTIDGGSRRYRDLLTAPFKKNIVCNLKVIRLKIRDQKVQLNFADGSEQTFDKVILACHADQALQLLESPSAEQDRLLSAFKYQPNLAVVHSDERVMPKTKRAWSSWNYVIKDQEASTVYWMNKLQGLNSKKNYFVSINPLQGSIEQSKIHRSLLYHHPLFDQAAINAQQQLPELNKKGPVYFCGSYFAYGFHEDAYKSAVELSETLTGTKKQAVQA